MRIRIFIFFIIIFSLHDTYAQYCVEGRFDTPVFDSLNIEIIPNIIYGKAYNVLGDSEELLLDIYRPLPELDVLGKKPLIVYVHGGSLKGGDKASGGSREFGYGFAENGFVYASINYRLGWNDDGNCKGDTVSLQYALYRAIQDTKAAIRFLKENAELYEIDTNNIFLGGSSVGCTVIVNATYALQRDYPQYLSDSLGSIDSASNTLFNHTFEIKGIFGKAIGIENPGILNNTSVPILFFHGTCDYTVPYKDGPLFFCYEPVEYMHYYGSWYLARIMEEKNIPYALYTNEAYEHDSANNDTVRLYVADFFKQILCNDIPVSAEHYRYNPGGCLVPDTDVVTFNYYPNPFQDDLYLSVNAAKEQDITLELFNAAGQKVFHDVQHYTPPITQYAVHVKKYGLANGIYFLRLSADGVVKTDLLYKQQ